MVKNIMKSGGKRAYRGSAECVTMDRFRTFVLLALLMIWSGCVIIPTTETKVLSGRRITDEQISPTQIGVTTKDEIISQLGYPDVFWVEQRIFAYNWKMRQAIIAWAVSNDYQGAFGAAEIGKDYVLLIQFDQNDYVQKFEVTKRSLFESYGDHLIEWVEQSQELPSAEPQE